MALTSTINWPLGTPQYNGWSEEPYDDVERFKPEVGPDIVRQRSGRVGSNYKGRFLMTTAQYLEFKTFYTNTLSNGYKSFNFMHPYTGVMKTVRFVGGSIGEQGAGAQLMSVNFEMEELSSA